MFRNIFLLSIDLTEPSVCSANVKQCLDNTFYKVCNSSGSAWGAAQSCASGTECTGAGECTPIVDWCSAESDCAVNQKCNLSTNQCEVDPNYCSDDNQCNIDEQCLDNVCEDVVCPTVDPTCNDFIYNNDCQVTPLADGISCGDNKICESGVCVDESQPQVCQWDYNQDGLAVDVQDLLVVLAGWNSASDQFRDGEVIGVQSLLGVLSGWGACE